MTGYAPFKSDKLFISMQINNTGYATYTKLSNKLY